jgi:hypothetical protein
VAGRDPRYPKTEGYILATPYASVRAAPPPVSHPGRQAPDHRSPRTLILRAALALLVAASLPVAITQGAAGDEASATIQSTEVASSTGTSTEDYDGVLVDHGVVIIDDDTGGRLSPAVLEGTLLPSSLGGFTKLSLVQRGDPQMTVRNTTGLPASVRTSVTTAVNAVNQIASANLQFGTDVARDALSGEIVVRAVSSTLCGGGAAGCAQFYVRTDDLGQYVVDRVNVEIASVWVGTSLELPIILHEFGHAMGLDHFDAFFENSYQVMRSFVDDSMTSFRSGDTNGLRSLLGAPFGNYESPVVFGPRTVTVQGWAIDPMSPNPVAIRVDVNGVTLTTTTADLPRPDIAEVYPDAGANRGFATTLTLTSPVNQVCLVATSSQSSAALGCRAVNLPTGNPVGNFEFATLTGPRTVAVRGWALDPDTASAIGIRVEVNGVTTSSGTADTPRPDVGAAFPGYGDNHGYNTSLTLATGSNRICLIAINSGPGANTSLGCRTVFLATGNPFGAVDAASIAGPRAIQVRGWTIDPDTAAPVAIHVYVDGRWGGAFTANVARPDVGRAFPGYGDNHGFNASLSASPGPRQVCVYAINVGAGSTNPLLGCRTVTVLSGVPFGNLESVSAVTGGVRIRGWTIDPDTTAPVAIHVYVDGRWGGAFTANVARPDVGRAFPGYGDNHGFNASLSASPGPRQVCVYAINVGAGSTNPLLGCRSVSVAV